MRVDDFWRFVSERHRIYLRRVAGGPPPWTDDEILSTYRFCNIYRELDTVTSWLRREWREPHADAPDLWFAFVVARHHNTIPFLDSLGGPPLPYDAERLASAAGAWQSAGGKVFSPAYIIGTRHRGSKTDYLSRMVYQPLWDARERLRPREGETLTGFHMSLGLFYGLASFMSAQVVADIKYTEPLLRATDWHTFAASGPGSRKGMHRLFGSRPTTNGTEDDFRLRLADLRLALLPRFEAEGWELPHAQDVQNMLCEFEKYERTRLGEGRPKQLFRGENG